MLNDVYLRGRENDLSALSADFDEFVNLQVKVANQNVRILINNQSVYEIEYDSSMGKLVGLRFKFQGLGKVKNYEIKNSDNEPIL